MISRPTTALLLSAALAVSPLLTSTPAQVSAKPTAKPFDLQAHRGGIGMTTEESLEGFAKALRSGSAPWSSTPR